MRQVRELSDSERLELEQAHRSGGSHRERMRAHAILLSSQGFDREMLATIFFTDRNTISDWFTRFEQGGVAALCDAPKSGRPIKLKAPAQSILRQALQNPTPALKPQLLERLKKGALRLSWKTVRRALKRLNALYRRARRVPARAGDPKRVPARAGDPKREARFVKALEKARLLCEQGAVDILHGDESGFCLLPSVPYLWQLKGQTVGLPAQSHNQRLNVLGFWREAGVEAPRLFFRLVKGRVQSRHLILAVEEQLLPFLARPTILLLDNAALHRSEVVTAKLKAWKRAGLHVWFLPPYCPHLNGIELQWKQIKHHALEPKDYADFPTLCAAVLRLLRQRDQKMIHYFCPTT